MPEMQRQRGHLTTCKQRPQEFESQFQLNTHLRISLWTLDLHFLKPPGEQL